MGSLYAELHLEGRAYPVRRADYSIHQEVDGRGRPRSKKRYGPLHLTLDVPDDEVLPAWAATPHKPLPGRVVFYDLVARVAHETIAFAAGECVRYVEDFESSNVGPGAYVCQLTITAPVFELRAGGPAAPLAPAAARHWAGGVGEAPTPGLRSAPGLPAAEGWLTDLETVMGPDAGVRTLVASWVAGGLSAEKLTSAMRGAVDKRLVFERLRDAVDVSKRGRGLYQQRVVIDDFDHIPGVSRQKYVRNGLPPVVIPASNFGVDDPAFDLPEGNTPTFTGSAILVEIKPGEKLYRVTSDPASDSFAKTGGYWTRTPPTNLAEVIGGTAVMPEWNNFQRVYEFTAPPYADPVKQEPKFYAWEGPAAAQPVSNIYKEKKDDGYSLPGGKMQQFIPNKLSRHPNFGTYIQDVTSQHKSW